MAAAALAFTLAAAPLRAQDAPDPSEVPPPSSQGQINIPTQITVFGHGDPDVRRPTAVINGDIITGTDVDQRLALVVAANGGKVGKDELERLRLQILRNLIDETLEIQEAATEDIKIDDAEVNEDYARVAQQNFHADPQVLDAKLLAMGSSPASLKRQIKGEMAWQRVLRRDVSPFVSVSDAEVHEVINRMEAAKGTEEYRIGEIFLSASPDAQGAVRQTAQQIVDQLHKGGSFVAYARQYSEASTAAVGGDLGWIHLAQLPTELANVARDMGPGQLAGPIPVRGGFDILTIIDKRQVLTADPRDAVLALKQVSIAIPAGLSAAEAQRRAEAFGDGLKAAKGCGTIDAVAAKLGAKVVANDQVPARNLPAALQGTLLKLSLGEMTPPFGSAAEGIRVLMLCGRDDPKAATGPNFDDMMAQMQDDRVNKRAQILLRDLRRDAVIEYN